MNFKALGTLRAIGSIIVTTLVAAVVASSANAQRLIGTLVVAVPATDGLVVCADKRLFNIDAGTYRDDSVKIRKVSSNVIFAATGTVGFYDLKSRKTVFDAFDVAARYASRKGVGDDREFWDGLKAEIKKELLRYFASCDHSEWPETDIANNGLLFNLVFYSVEGSEARSRTVQVFYEKKRSPVLTVMGPVTERIRSPKLSGKGRELIAYIAANPPLSSDPLIQKFDGSRFQRQQTSVGDAVEFARMLFRTPTPGYRKLKSARRSIVLS